MNEKPKRLTPRPETLRELFLKSGNLCAFPNCTSLMMNVDGVFIGQVCHIQAAEEGGERFNPDMTNEQRRAAANLMLMCYEHHQVTNDEKKYPVSKLEKIKRDHERRFSSPDRAILARLTDWTTIERPLGARNLGRMNKVLGWNHTAGNLEESIEELNQYIEKLRRVPIETRRFIGAVAMRMHRVKDTFAVQDQLSSVKLLISDFKDAFRMGDRTINERLAQLDSYGLGDLDDINTSMGPQPAIRIVHLKSGWPIWPDIAAFCHATDTPIERFTEDLDFSSLDDPA